MHGYAKQWLVILFSTFLISVTTQAEDLPRGSEIGSDAGNCSVGPFGQTEDAGSYQHLCSSIKRTEICFAYLKGHITQEGTVLEAHDSAKATFCMNILLSDITR